MIKTILFVLGFFCLLARLIPWRNRRVHTYRVEKMNSRQSIPAVHISPALEHAARPQTKPQLKAVN
jgi:hypothetical protein